MKLLIINGPNLNLLKLRDDSHYGSLELDLINEMVLRNFPDINFEFFQSNIEGEIVEKIQQAEGNFDGIIINPGGYSHTSVAIRDALELVSIPKIEVHLSNLAGREGFRSKQITAAVCNGYISGFKEFSYLAAVFLLKHIVKK